MRQSRDRCHLVVSFHVPQGQLTHEDSGGFRFNITCHDCSNSFVNEYHTAHVLHALIFEIQASLKKRVKGRS